MISLKDAAKRNYNNIFVIGRFQPLHKGHMQMLSNAFNIIWPDEMTVIVGNSGKISARNPMTMEQVVRQFEVLEIPASWDILKDNEDWDLWYEDLMKIIMPSSLGIHGLLCPCKDADTTSYLYWIEEKFKNSFDSYMHLDFIKIEDISNINASDIRNGMYGKDLDLIPSHILDERLKNYLKTNHIQIFG